MRQPLPGMAGLVTLLLALPTAASGQDTSKVDLTGVWTFTVTTDAGSGSPTVTLKQAGDSLTGHYSSQIFGEPELKGNVKGRTFAVSFTASVEGQSLTVTYSGTIESNDDLKGTVNLGDFGSGTFTAKRKPPPEAWLFDVDPHGIR